MENALVKANTLLSKTREDSTHGYHQMVNTEIRLIIFSAAKDGEALYSRADCGSDHELLISKLRHKFGPKSNPIQLYIGSEK